MKDYVKTSDTPFAAYLMLHDFTLLGCVDTGKTSPHSGMPCYEFFLSHSEEDKRENIQEYANELRDVFQSETGGYREFFLHMKLLNRKARSPMTLKDVGEY